MHAGRVRAVVRLLAGSHATVHSGHRAWRIVFDWPVDAAVPVRVMMPISNRPVQAVISPTIADAVAHLVRDDVWPSHELPGGNRHALVDQVMEIDRGKAVPVLVDDEVRVVLFVEARDDGYTISGLARCR